MKMLPSVIVCALAALCFLVKGNTSLRASATCDAAMIAPHTNACSFQRAQAAMLPLEAMARTVPRAVTLTEIIPVAPDIARGHLQFNHLSPVQLLLSMGICGCFAHLVKSNLGCEVTLPGSVAIL